MGLQNCGCEKAGQDSPCLCWFQTNCKSAVGGKPVPFAHSRGIVFETCWRCDVHCVRSVSCLPTRQQIELEEDSRQYVVVNTHKGLYRYTIFPYEIASAPAIFQNVMESLLSDIPGVGIYLDDLLITGKSAEEHDRNDEQVLDKLEKSNMRLKFHKCSFSQDEVRYLGHRINYAGIKPLPDKVRAIAMAPDPTDVSELRSFLGLR